MAKKPTRLHVLDFDGTLVRSPHPDTPMNGVPALDFYDAWLAERGLPRRKFQGWWGRRETLLPPLFGEFGPGGEFVPPPDAVNKDLARVVKMSYEDPNTLCVLMTGRHAKMRRPETGEHVCKMALDAYGLRFDAYFYGSTGQPTIAFKANVIQGLLREHPSIREVEVWEDREAHVSEFWDLIKFAKRQGKLDSGCVHQVYFADHGDMPETA